MPAHPHPSGYLPPQNGQEIMGCPFGAACNKFGEILQIVLLLVQTHRRIETTSGMSCRIHLELVFCNAFFSPSTELIVFLRVLWHVTDNYTCLWILDLRHKLRNILTRTTILQRSRGYIRPSLFTHIPYQSPHSLKLSNMPATAYSWIPHCYLPTRRSDHIDADVYQSVVPDPYAWLEKDGYEVERWVTSQEAARSFLDSHPDRAQLEKEIRASTDGEKVSFLTM